MALFCFFFFKQKTAYEMRISDWSSDVCSSDLPSDGNHCTSLLRPDRHCLATPFLLCSKTMSATAFDSDASLDERRVIIRRGGGDVEMVKLPWGLQPREIGGRPFTVLRAEDRTFPRSEARRVGKGCVSTVSVGCATDL